MVTSSYSIANWIQTSIEQHHTDTVSREKKKNRLSKTHLGILENKHSLLQRQMHGG